MAAARSMRAICFSLITIHGADPEIKNKYGNTPVHYAAQYGNLSTVKTLVRYGGNPTTKNAHGKTPANLAFERGAELAIVEYFIKAEETERRKAYLTEVEGRRLEVAREKTETEAEREAQRRAKLDSFFSDVLQDYRLWRKPPGNPGEFMFANFMKQFAHPPPFPLH